MKILHLGKFYPPDPGGIEKVVQGLAEGAARAGNEVRVVVARGGGWKGPAAAEPRMSERNGVTVVRTSTAGVLWSQPISPGYLAAARWPADVVYLHRPHPLADVAAILTRPKNLVLFHHSDVQRQRSIKWIYSPLAHWVGRRARVSVLAAKANLEHADDLGSRAKENSRVIPFGVDHLRFHNGPPERVPHVFQSLPGPTGIFVGRIVEYKGLDVLLKALSRTDLSFVIVGDGPLRPSLEKESRRLGLDGRVVFAGAVEDKWLPAYYQSADYLVLPSTSPQEMFGVTLIEAMSCGKPVISTSVSSGVREVNDPEVTGLEVRPGNVDELRTALVRMTQGGVARELMGQAARRRVEQLFTLDKMIQAHLDLCEEIKAESQG